MDPVDITLMKMNADDLALEDVTLTSDGHTICIHDAAFPHSDIPLMTWSLATGEEV